MRNTLYTCPRWNVYLVSFETRSARVEGFAKMLPVTIKTFFEVLQIRVKYLVGVGEKEIKLFGKIFLDNNMLSY